MRNNVPFTLENDKVSAAASSLYGRMWAKDGTAAFYHVAVRGKSNQYANMLTDEALALCGDPYYDKDQRRWGPMAKRFLECFPGSWEKELEHKTCIIYRNRYTRLIRIETAPGAKPDVNDIKEALDKLAEQRKWEV